MNGGGPANHSDLWFVTAFNQCRNPGFINHQKKTQRKLSHWEWLWPFISCNIPALYIWFTSAEQHHWCYHLHLCFYTNSNCDSDWFMIKLSSDPDTKSCTRELQMSKIKDPEINSFIFIFVIIIGGSQLCGKLKVKHLHCQNDKNID